MWPPRRSCQEMGRSSVSVVVEIPAGTLNRTDDVSQPASRVRLSIGFYKKDGASVGGEDPTIDVSRVPGETFRFVSSIPVPPGVYRLWVGAVETRSRVSGSVMTDIEVPDFNRPMLALSGITVSIGEPPLAGRQFSANDELSLCGETVRSATVALVPSSPRLPVSSDAGRAVYQTPFAPARATRWTLRAYSAESARGWARTVATVEAVSTAPRRVSVTRTVAFRVR